MSVCVSTKHPSSHLGRHVSRAVVVVPLLDLSCTFHSHSNPDFLIVPFTWRWPLRRSTIWSDVWPIGWTRHSCPLGAQRPHWNEQYRGYTDILPQTERDVDLRFCWEHYTPPPESDVDGEQKRDMLASPLYLQEREASADPPRVYHSCRENSVSSSSRFRPSAERPAAVFSHRRQSSQESHSDRDGIPLALRAAQGQNEALSRLSESENDTRLILEEQRDHLLAEAKSEVLKQECRGDFLDCSLRELQRQCHSSRMDIDHTNLGYETSRREQARLHEELAQRERALRETHIQIIHEVEEMKRAQEMRIDEFSRQATAHELASHTQELQDSVNLMNDSGEVQDAESPCSGRLSHIPSQPAIVPSPRSLLSRDQKPATWYMELAWYIGKRFLTIHLHQSTRTLRRNASFLACDQARGDLQLEVKNRTETLYRRRDLQGDSRTGILSFQQKENTQRIARLINKNFRSRSFILTSSPHLQRFHVGRWDSKPQ